MHAAVQRVILAMSNGPEHKHSRETLMLFQGMDRRDVNAFEPEAIKVMHQAYTEACIALCVFAGDRRGQEAVAARVIDLARSGVMDPKALRDRVLLEGRLAA